MKLSHVSTFLGKGHLEILNMGHLIAHGNDQLKVECGWSSGQLKFIDVGCHCFQGVKSEQGFSDLFQVGWRYPFSPKHEILAPHLRSDNRMTSCLIQIFHVKTPLSMPLFLNSDLINLSEKGKIFMKQMETMNFLYRVL